MKYIFNILELPSMYPPSQQLHARHWWKQHAASTNLAPNTRCLVCGTVISNNNMHIHLAKAHGFQKPPPVVRHLSDGKMVIFESHIDVKVITFHTDGYGHRRARALEYRKLDYQWQRKVASECGKIWYEPSRLDFDSLI